MMRTNPPTVSPMPEGERARRMRRLSQLLLGPSEPLTIKKGAPSDQEDERPDSAPARKTEHVE